MNNNNNKIIIIINIIITIIILIIIPILITRCLRIFSAGMVEEDERPIPMKYPILQVQNIASDSPSPTPGLHVAEPFRNVGTNGRRDERRVSGTFNEPVLRVG